MDDTLTIWIENTGENERRRRRRRRWLALLLGGGIAAALLGQEEPRGTVVPEKPVVIVSEGPIGPRQPELPPLPPVGNENGGAEALPALPAKAVAAPSRLDFGEGPLSRGAAAQLATIRNDGGSAIGRVSVTAGKPFLATDTCRRGIQPGGECVVAVVFAPAEAGLFTAMLHVSAGDERLHIPLRGRVTEPVKPPPPPSDPAPPSDPPLPPAPERPRVLCFDPPSITFLTAGTKWMTLRNRQPEPLRIAAIRLLRNGAEAPDHRIAVNGCLGTLAPGAQCRFSVSAGRRAVAQHDTVQIAVDAVDPGTDRTFPVHRDPDCRR